MRIENNGRAAETGAKDTRNCAVVRLVGLANVALGIGAVAFMLHLCGAELSPVPVAATVAAVLGQVAALISLKGVEE